MDSKPLKRYLKEEGATLVGVGDITIALTREIVHLNRGIALALNRGLNRDTNAQLVLLQQLTDAWLKKEGVQEFISAAGFGQREEQIYRQALPSRQP